MGELTRTHVSITEEQKDWADENHINLSSLLRSAIDDRREE